MDTLQRAQHFKLLLLKSPESIWRAGMLGVVVFFILTGITLTIRLATLGQEASTISRSQDILGNIDDLFGNVRDIESGERGYLLTHRVEYLDPKKNAEQKIPFSIEKLKMLTAHNRRQHKLAQEVQFLVDEKLKEVNRILTVAHTQSFAAAADALKEGRGKSIMDRLREVFHTMQRKEEATLRRGILTFENTRQGGKFIALVTVIITILLTLLVMYTSSVFRSNAATLAIATAARKEAERALQTSEQRLRAALAHIALRVYSTDIKGRYTWIHHAENQLDLSTPIGKRDDEIYSSGDIPELMEMQRIVLRTNKLMRKVLKLPYTGKLLSYDVIIEPYAPQQGSILGLTILAFDIQNQIETQEQLKKSANELQAITNTMPQFVWSCDASGIPDYFNDRWYEYTGMDVQDKTGWTSEKYLHPEDRRKTLDIWFDCRRSGKPFAAECRLRNGNYNTYNWFICRALPVFDDRKKITRWFGTCTDINDQKEIANEREILLESERIARDEAERAIRAKDEYIATLSHELRGPLNSILGWTQIIRAKMDNVPMIERGITVIERNARIQAQLVTDLFDMHRISAGKLGITIEAVHLSELVDAAVDSFLPAAQEKNIKITKKIEPNVCNVPGEPSRLTQVISNILNNSLKFTPEGGQITISLEMREGKSIITTTDTGIGVEASSLPGIFDRYNQGTGGNGTKYSGLGLGLSIARSFIQMHKGTIEASSDGIGKGTTFRITLPCSIQDDSSIVTATTGASLQCTSHPKSLTGIKIFFIEDQDDSREAITRLLNEQEANVISFSSCIDALEKLDVELPHIIVSDISMRGMDGYMFMKIVRERHPSLPAIALSAFVQTEDRERALAVGFNHYLVKPVDTVNLINTITSLLPENTPSLAFTVTT